MRGCAMSFLLWMAGAALSVAAVMAFFFYFFDPPPSGSFGAGIFAGGLVWISLNLWSAAWKSWRRKGAMQNAIAGLSLPVDGRESVFVGALEPLGETLVAPLDGSPALVYEYKVKEEVGTGKQRMIYTHYKGVGLAPSVLRTRGGSYPLLVVPEFEGPDQPLGADSARLAFEKYLGETRFSPRKEVKHRELEARWSDADGSYRSDISDVGDKTVDLANCRFEQHRVRPGEQVCIFGHYAAGRGIVPHRNWANSAKLLVGDTTEVARTLGSQVKTRVVLAILTGGAAAGIVAGVANS